MSGSQQRFYSCTYTNKESTRSGGFSTASMYIVIQNSMISKIPLLSSDAYANDRYQN